MAAKHSAGSARAECYPGVGNSCPCYGKCVREVPPKVRGLEPDFSRTMLATAAMVSAACAHVDCYPSVGNPWPCYYTFGRSRLLPATVRGGHILGSVGVAICIGLGGARETAFECIPSTIFKFAHAPLPYHLHVASDTPGVLYYHTCSNLFDTLITWTLPANNFFLSNYFRQPNGQERELYKCRTPAVSTFE